MCLESKIKEINLRLIAFIDILGFKDITNKRVNSQEIIKFLEKIRNMTSDYKMYTNSENGIPSLQIKPDFISFSDHMIISYPISQNHTFDTHMQYMRSSIVKIQLELLNDGYLIRGAISIGDLYWDSKNMIIFGSSLNEAVENEMKHAIYPRVMICNSVLDFISREGLEKPFFEEDFDGIYYLDYIRNSTIENLLVYQSIVRKNLNDSLINENITKKCKWEWLSKKLLQKISSSNI